MKIFMIFLTLVLGGCGGMQIQVRGEGMGAVGLANLARAIHDGQKQLFCPQGIAAERREVRVNTYPDSDPMSYPQRQRIWVDSQGEVICR